MNKTSILTDIRAFLVLIIVMAMSAIAVGQNASFSVNPSQGCAPLQVQCTDLSTGATQWAWSITGTGTPPSGSSDPNPGFTFVNPGTYTITLTINGGASSFSQNVTVFKLPQPDFIASPRNGCAPLSVQFNDQTILGDAPIVSWEWDLGEPPIQTVQNPSITYVKNNTLDIVLVVTDANGCSKFIRKDDYIAVDKPPDPNFTVSPSGSCTVPFTPTITNTTPVNQAGLTYNWSFPGAGVSPATANTQNPPAVTYTQNGTYDISLSINDNGCVDDTTIVGAVVIDQLTTDFNISNTSPCQAESVTFTDNSSIGGLVYQWYVNGSLEGTNSAIFSTSFSSTGNKNVCLVSSTIDGICRDSICKTVTVQSGPTVDFTANNTLSCGVPFTVNFTSNATNTVSYFWSITPSTGVSPSATSTAANPSFTFNNPGNYTVSLTATSASGCTRTVTKNNFVKINDNINVTVTSNVQDNEGCAPLNIVFDVSANLPAGTTVTGVTWDLPGGSPSSGSGSPTSIATTYNSFGDYVATATVNFSGGCSQSVASLAIEVGDKPNLTMNVTPDNICINESVSGTATSDIPGTQFDWYFESPGGYYNGGIGTSSNVTYNYEDEWAQPFDVLLVGDVNGCKDTLSLDVIVNPPAAKFTFKPVCGEPTKIRLIPNKVQGQFADDIVWNLVSGPGSPAVLGTFSNINNAEIVVDLGSVDVFQIQLIVSSAFTGCTDSVRSTIDLSNISGNATVNPSEICPGESVSFYDNTPGVVAWKWYFGDGDSTDFFGSPQTINHVYTNSGTYTATLRTRDNSNPPCVQLTQYTITVGGGVADLDGILGSCTTPFTPTLNATMLSSNGGANVIADANWLIQTDGGGVQAYNNTLNPSPPPYNSPGQYTIQLTTFDAIGCSDDTTATLIVGGAVAGFSSDKTNICPGEQVNFNNLSLGGNLTYNWSFSGGSPSSSTDENPVVTYGSAGNYNVTLTVTSTVNGATCSDDTTANFYITVTGSGFDFIVDKDSANCPTLTSNFTMIPQPAPGQLNYIKWYYELDTDEPGYSGDELVGFANGTNIYTAGSPHDGYWDVALVVDGTLCRDSIYKKDFIFIGGQAGRFTFDPDTICAPDDVLFSQVNVVRTDSIFWDFGDGQTLNDVVSTDNILVTYDDPGVFKPLILLKAESCPPVEVEIGRSVYVSRLKAGAIVDRDYLCDLGQIMFADSSIIDSAQTTGDFVAGVLWNFGDGTSSTQTNPTHDYDGSITGNLTINYEVTTDFGCTDDTSFIIKIFETPTGSIGPGKSICIGDNVQLSASGASNYLWSPSNIIINSTSATPTVLPSDTTVFQVVMYNDTIVCADTLTVQVDVLKEIQGLVGPDAQICAGETVELLAEATEFPQDGTIDYTWTPAAGLSNPNIPNPIASPNSTTVYSVTISSGLCAPEQANVTIEVSGAPFVDAGEDQVVISGTQVDLTAFSPSIVTYNWFDSEGNFIDNTQSITTDPITETSTFFVEVGNGGCRAIDSVVLLILEDCSRGIATVPNVFTPNNDGVNDLLKITPGLGIAEVSTFKIFNRWGEIVFEADTETAAWDGTQNGKELDPGVYVYYMELVCTNLERSIRKGNITLLK
ncbi:MAG: PKD domain-containing protein [Chitinophagales bacterium]